MARNDGRLVTRKDLRLFAEDLIFLMMFSRLQDQAEVERTIFRLCPDLDGPQREQAAKVLCL